MKPGPFSNRVKRAFATLACVVVLLNGACSSHPDAEKKQADTATSQSASTSDPCIEVTETATLKPASEGVANPLAAILSFEMALRWSLDRPDLADRLFDAVKAALDGGARTRDIGGTLTTAEMGDAVLKGL